MGYQIIRRLHFNYTWLILFIAYIFKNYARRENWKHFALGDTCPIKGPNITHKRPRAPSCLKEHSPSSKGGKRRKALQSHVSSPFERQHLSIRRMKAAAAQQGLGSCVLQQAKGQRRSLPSPHPPSVEQLLQTETTDRAIAHSEDKVLPHP